LMRPALLVCGFYHSSESVGSCSSLLRLGRRGAVAVSRAKSELSRTYVAILVRERRRKIDARAPDDDFLIFFFIEAAGDAGRGLGSPGARATAWTGAYGTARTFLGSQKVICSIY